PLRLDVEPPCVRDAEERPQGGTGEAAALLGGGGPGRGGGGGGGGAGGGGARHAPMYPHPDGDVHMWTFGPSPLTRLARRSYGLRGRIVDEVRPLLRASASPAVGRRCRVRPAP